MGGECALQCTGVGERRRYKGRNARTILQYGSLCCFWLGAQGAAKQHACHQTAGPGRHGEASQSQQGRKAWYEGSDAEFCS